MSFTPYLYNEWHSKALLVAGICSYYGNTRNAANILQSNTVTQMYLAPDSQIT